MSATLHCWKGKREEMEERFGFGSEEWARTFDEGGDGTCMLARDHKGPHKYTPDTEIVIRFSDGKARAWA